MMIKKNANNKAGLTVALSLCALLTCSCYNNPMRSQVQPPPGSIPGATQVQIRSGQFEPRQLIVTKGTLVHWANLAKDTHTIDSGRPTKPTTLFNYSLFEGDEDSDSASHLFNESGIFEYYCGIHMAIGKIIVRDETAIEKQLWKTYEARDINIQVDIPAQWQAETGSAGGIPFLAGFDEDETIALFTYAEVANEATIEMLLEDTMKRLYFEIEGEVEKKDLNGLMALLVIGSGKFQEESMGVVLMTATFKRQNYLACVLGQYSEFQNKKPDLVRIIESITPIEG